MMKISGNDPFDLDLCIRGLGNQLTYMHNDIFDYMYNRIERPGRTPCINAFKELQENCLYDYRKFQSHKSHYVQLCFRIDQNIRKYKEVLCVIWNIDEAADLQDALIMEQAKRYSPRLLPFKKSRNFVKVDSFYAKVLTSFDECLHSYLCAIITGSYKIPIEKNAQVKLCEQNDLIPLSENEEIVPLLDGLIDDIRGDITAYDRRVEKTVRSMGGWKKISWG